MDHPRISTVGSGASSDTRNLQNNQTNRNGTSIGNENPTPAFQKTGNQFGTIKNATNLRLGDVVRGEITDISNGEITITLENNTMIRGKISENASLSIGQTAEFKLSSLNPQGIVIIEPYRGYTENELTMINKALEEANLPATNMNQAVVKALIDNTMPINRDSIQSLLHQSNEMQTSDLNTLALMNRLMLKTTPDMVQQFSNYRHGTEQLAFQIDHFSNNISELLGALSENGPADAVTSFAKQLFEVTIPQTSNQPEQPQTISMLSTARQQELSEALADYPMTDATATALRQGTMSLSEAQQLLQNALSIAKSNEDASVITNQQNLEQAGEVLEDLLANTETSTEQMDEQLAQLTTITESENSSNHFSLRFAGKFLHNLQENASQSLNQTLQALRNSMETITNPAQNQMMEDPSLLDYIRDIVDTEANQNSFLGSFLSDQELKQLSDLLQKLPISKSLIAKVDSGQISAPEVMHIIKNVLPMSDSQTLSSLFQSHSFEQLFAKAMSDQWSLTPKQLMEPEQPDKLYNELSNQMKQISQLIGNALNGSDSEQLQHHAKDIQSNIDMMKQLSENFSYMQLPLKLPNQKTNGELYVYTQKEQRKTNPEKMSVLLQLDLEHLGNIEIRLDKDHANIMANFRMTDDASVDLLKTNTTVLTQNLTNLGYQSNIVVSKQNESKATMDQFLNTKVKTNATEEMKRFSFDIRA